MITKPDAAYCSAAASGTRKNRHQVRGYIACRESPIRSIQPNVNPHIASKDHLVLDVLTWFGCETKTGLTAMGVVRAFGYFSR